MQHGLSLPVVLDQVFSPEIEKLASAIAGSGASDTRLACATQIAEAQVDLVRTRAARRSMFGDPHARIKKLTVALKRRAISIIKVIHRVDDRTYRKRLKQAPEGSRAHFDLEWDVDVAAAEIFALVDGRPAPDAKPPSLVEALDVVAEKLARLDRYERRALSLRRRAMPALDALA